MRIGDSIVVGSTNLEQDVVDAFTKLGKGQRGSPEYTMVDIQRYHQGVYSFVVEHAGDITHRMSHMAKYGSLGREYVVEKAAKVLRSLKSGYGFAKEMNENMKANLKGGDSLADHKKKLQNLSKKYADAHRSLIVYNKPQWYARQAAIEIGEWNWKDAIKYLEALLKIAKNKNQYEEMASKVERKGNKIVPYH